MSSSQCPVCQTEHGTRLRCMHHCQYSSRRCWQETLAGNVPALDPVIVRSLDERDLETRRSARGRRDVQEPSRSFLFCLGSFLLTTVPEHRHVLQLILNTFFGLVDISQSEAVFRNYCFAERFGHQICNVFLTLDTTHSLPFGSDFIFHPQVCHINVLSSTNPLSVEDVFGGLRING